jgi:antitoxin HicB
MTKNLDYYMSLPYPILLIPEDDGTFYVKIPLLDGCVSVGNDPQDAYEMIEDAKRIWLEGALADGDDIPEPEREMA